MNTIQSGLTRVQFAPFALALAATLMLAAAATAAPDARLPEKIPQPSLERLKPGMPVAPESRRVDMAMPKFSNPTRISNPLFPIGALHSAVLLGHIDARTFRSETTLLPNPKTIVWMGQKIQALESQYLAFLDGRIDEVALDWYAQSDDGSVWYLGEDVFNYADGAIADREGTWVAGEDGPAAMIMPAQPRVGDVFRPENIPGSVWEEVTVKSIGTTVDGPHGPVPGAITTQELHQDGALSDKIFAPGYGEFRTGSDRELEALALAVPKDALPGPMPSELETLANGAGVIFDAARAGDWDRAIDVLRGMRAAWNAYRATGDVPKLLAAQMDRALAAMSGDALAPAVGARDVAGTARATTGIALAALDLQLRHRPVLEIDRARFEVWARQLVFDAGGDEPGSVAGDVTTLEWVRDRFVHALDAGDGTRLSADLAELRAAADAEDMARAARLAPRFRQTVAALKLVSNRP